MAAGAEGIITFPSLHAALGVLFPAALWHVSGVRWIALALNALLLISTPAYGSHYVVDVVAGSYDAAIRIGEVIGRAAEIHQGEVELPGVLVHARPAPHDLLERGGIALDDLQSFGGSGIIQSSGA